MWLLPVRGALGATLAEERIAVCGPTFFSLNTEKRAVLGRLVATAGVCARVWQAIRWLPKRTQTFFLICFGFDPRNLETNRLDLLKSARLIKKLFSKIGLTVGQPSIR